MTSFGQTLRNAREAKGLTCSQVAAQTHMLVQTVEEMEKEDFHRIPAPIYGRGFVRLFAECVGLDPVPLVREFMDIYEGRRAPTVRPRPVPPAPEPVAPAPLPEPVPAPEPVIPAPAAAEEETEEESVESFDYPPPASLEPDTPEPAPQPVDAVPDVIDPFAAAPSEPVPEPVPEPVAPPPPPPAPEQPLSVRGLDLFDPPPAAPVPPPAPAAEPPRPYESPYLSSSAYEEKTGPSAAERFRQSLSAVSHNVVSTWNNIPRRTWRIAALAAAGLLVLALLIWGCKKLYEATTPSAPPPEPAPAAAPAPAVTPAPAAATKPAKPAGPVTLRSTGQKIPPLYAD